MFFEYQSCMHWIGRKKYLFVIFIIFSLISIHYVDARQGYGKIETQKEIQLAQGIASQQIKRSFQEFASRWLSRIESNLVAGRTDIQTTFKNGEHVAFYYALEKQSLKVEIQEANASPLGIMTYLEHRYESRVKSQTAARQGDFEKVLSKKCIEIFVYHEGQWH